MIVLRSRHIYFTRARCEPFHQTFFLARCPVILQEVLHRHRRMWPINIVGGVSITPTRLTSE